MRSSNATRTSAPPRLGWLPREHGAWGLLFQPFVAGAVLGGRWTWTLAPAAALLFLGFIVREPLVILARQAFVWRTPNPQTPLALRWLLFELGGLGLCAWLLSADIPARSMAAFLLAGALLTASAVWVIVRNRQRTLAFQLVSAALLGGTAPLGVFVASGTLPPWAYLLWATLTLHAAASILVVHARLARKSAARSAPEPSSFRTDLGRQFLPFPAALALAAFHWPLALPAAYSMAAGVWEVRRICGEGGLQEPLTRVGIRTLASSLVHMLLTIGALWRTAGGSS